MHVLGVDQDDLVEAISKRYAKLGLELATGANHRELNLARVRIVRSKRWFSVAIEDLDEPDAWTEYLSKTLDTSVLGTWFWDGEDSLRLLLCTEGGTRGELTLPRGASKDPDGKARVALGAFSRLVPNAKEGAALDLRFDAETHFDRKLGCIFIEAEPSQRALCRAFGLTELFPDPYAEDTDDPALELRLIFRPKAGSKLRKKQDQAAAAQVKERRADHDGRIYAVGSMVLGTDARSMPKQLLAVARPLIKAFAPHLTHVEATRVDAEGRSSGALPPPAAGDRAWTAYAQALRAGLRVDITRKAPVVASVWLALDGDLLTVGWCFRALKEESGRNEVAQSVEAALLTAAQSGRCVNAIVTSQTSPMTLGQRALAYEYLRGRSVVALRPEWQRDHVRSPGWRVLLPKTTSAPAQLPTGFSSLPTKSGVLVRASASNPYAVTAAALDALEKWLEPVLGESQDIAHL
jgi:hypothetical protein